MLFLKFYISDAYCIWLNSADRKTFNSQFLLDLYFLSLFHFFFLFLTSPPPSLGLTYIPRGLCFPFCSFFRTSLEYPVVCSCLSYSLSPYTNWPASWSSCVLQQTSRWWTSNPIFSSHPLQLSPQPSAFWRTRGTTEDEILSSITFKSLHLSAEPLVLQSFSLAFCQFSRLSNDLSDRSKSSGWDLGSLRKLGMLHWRIWRLHGNMQWILSFGLSVYALYLSVYWSGCHPVNWSEYLCQAICRFGPWVKSSSF